MSSVQLDSNTLSWVKSEIDETLNQARTALEAYVEDPADQSQLRFCINYLHQIHGTLQMVELYGAALGIEEMEKLSQAILDEKVSNKEYAFEALMRGILQIPDYLEHLLAGHRDLPVVLLPLMNDLRAARGEALLSEGALFTPDLTVNAPAAEMHLGKEDSLQVLARKLRHNYHLGLLGWFKGQNVEASLQKLEDVINQLASHAEYSEARRVLWIANGLAESLRNGGVDTSVSVKLLMGQLDRQIKKIIDSGEQALDEQPPHDLEKNLLYYVASSTSHGDKTKEIKQAFNLEAIMPDTKALEQARADLSGPNAALMQTVSAVLLEDLNRVKDTLDVFVRTDTKDMSVLEEIRATLTQMSDTLGMLGLGLQRQAVLKQNEILAELISGSQQITEQKMMDIAAAMISVENSLTEVTTARAVSEEIEVTEGVDVGEKAMEKLHDAEQQKLMQTVLAEAKNNFAKVKEIISDFSRNNTQRELLGEIPGLLQQVKGSLSILSLDKAASLLSACNDYISEHLIGKKIAPDQDEMNNLADAISSLEYYMESLMGKWGQPEAILDVAEQSLRALKVTIADTADTTPATPIPAVVPDKVTESSIAPEAGMALTEEPPQPESGTLEELSFDLGSTEENEPGLSLELESEQAGNDVSLDDLTLELSEVADTLTVDDTDSEVVELSLDGISLDEESPADTSTEEIQLEYTPEPAAPVVAPPQPVVTPPSAPAATSLVDDNTIDDEIIEIFLEEAEEEYQNISRLLPTWEASADEATLKEIRRSFHTLKGSGRLVGAANVGEFAWAFENMLNRVIDRTIPITPILIEVLKRGHQALPRLFDMFKTGAKPGQDILALMDYADSLSQGKEVELVDIPQEVESTSGVEAEVDLDISADSELEAFVPQESEEILELAEELPAVVVEEVAELPPLPIDIDPVLLDIYRKEVSTHINTLKAYVNEWQQGNTEPSHNLLRSLHTLTGSSRTTTIQSLAEVCSQFEHYVKHLQDQEARFPAEAVSLLQQTIDLIESTVACLDQPGAKLPEHAELLANISNLKDKVATQISEPAPVEPPPAAVAEPTTPVAAAPVAAPDYDEELLEIFLEEGTEILDESDQTLHEWIENPSDQSLVEALQRHLHTLKGGARMAGIREIGDLGHSIESLLTAVVDGHLGVSKPMFELLQRAQDRLVKMLEQVQSNQVPAPANELLVEVESLLERGSLDITPEVEPSESDEIVVSEPLSVEPEAEIQLEPVEPANELDFGLDFDFDDEPTAPAIAAEDEAITIEEELPVVEVEEPEPEAELISEPTEPVLEPEVIAAELQPAPDNIIPLPPSAPVEETTTELVPEEEDDGSRDRRKAARIQHEQIRVRADLLDNLVNFAGEVSIYRSRLEQQTNSFRFNIQELEDTVSRLREQLRQFEIETEAQIQYRREETLGSAHEDFDPLEFDRFTTMQHLSRAMLESLSDLDSLRGILGNITRESETLLLQQSRVNTELQEGLMRTRMVPFSGQAARLRRIIRQTSDELGKKADLHLQGVEAELDRTVLDRVIPPIEHMLRNAVAHGIENPEARKQSGKNPEGRIDLSISREGSEIIIKISDDGAGINLEAIRKKAIERGLIKADTKVSKDDLLDMIMQSGFSTAETVSQISGRGVGMDVVNTEIKQLGGIFIIDTEQGKGTTFTVSLPLTLAVSRALMVNVGEETYAIPLLSVEGVERISTEELKSITDQEKPVYQWVGQDYHFIHLGTVMGISEMTLPEEGRKMPLLLVRSGDNRAAILVEGLLGSREIVVKPVGPQLSTLRGISGATIMGDGSVVLIVDLGVLIRLAATRGSEDVIEVTPEPAISVQSVAKVPTVMVVDDSITVRKVTTRLLERNSMQVVAAKDGVDALAQLQEITPDIMLLDVEMPRMDGFELATNVRNDDRLKHIPIIMITSRTGQKHRDRAASIGVNVYMGKPYTESDLLDNIHMLIGD